MATSKPAWQADCVSCVDTVKIISAAVLVAGVAAAGCISYRAARAAREDAYINGYNDGHDSGFRSGYAEGNLMGWHEGSGIPSPW